MSITPIPITESLAHYIEGTLRFPQPLQDLIALTRKQPNAIMLTNPAQIQLISTLMKVINAKHVIEVGVFTGCTTLAVALALPDDGHIIACDIDETAIAVGRPFWEAANVIERICVKIAPAMDTLNHLIETGKANHFDAVYIDADKKQYPEYYKASLTLLRQGGLLLFDNLLQSGKVADLNIQDEQTAVIRTLTEQLADDDQIDFSLITQGDGLGVAYKR